MSLFLDDGDVRLYHGDALTVLQDLPAGSVHMCVTSPPFYGLRDYGTGRWEGGNPDCDHAERLARNDSDRLDAGLGGGHGGGTTVNTSIQYRDVCGKCGARRVDQQIGLEETPELWVASLVAVFREVRRVLRDDGTLWLEIGDSYNGSGPNTNAGFNERYGRPVGQRKQERQSSGVIRSDPLCKPKDLIGAPWALAFALRADGWYLRSDIVWARPNPMPESVTDRPTKSHSYIFLLAKQPRYFWDAEAVKESSPDGLVNRVGSIPRKKDVDGSGDGRGERFAYDRNQGNGRNVRSVWNIATQPYPEAHFATFPEELARRCILAGTSERGCCPECGAPWIRQVERQNESTYARIQREHGITYQDMKAEAEANGITPGNVGGTHAPGQRGATYATAENLTTGWRLGCVHDGHTPCVVLDPFVGSGTVPYVARKHGRHAIGIDLSQSYLELASRRLQQLSLFA